MITEEYRRRRNLIKLRASIIREQLRGGPMPDLVFRDEVADESEPIDLVDLLELELRD